MTLTDDHRIQGPAGGQAGVGGVGVGDADGPSTGRERGAAPGVLAAGQGAGRSLLEPALVAVVASLTGLAFRPVFAPEPVVSLAVGGAVAAVAVSTLAARVARWPASAAALASLAAAPAVLAALAWRAAPTPSTWVDVARAVTAAPSRILSAPLPAPDRPELLVLVAASAWVTAHVAAELAARTRAPLAPLAPVAPALAVPLLLGVGGPRPGAAIVGGLAVACGALTLVRASALPSVPGPERGRWPGRGRGGRGWSGSSTSTPGPASGQAPGGRGTAMAAAAGARRAPAVLAGPGARAARRRRLLSALIMVGVAGLVPALAGDTLPFAAGEARVDPRGRVTDTAPQLRSPLVEVSAQRLAPAPEVAFTARGPAGIELWRTAVLDEYDGASWRSSGVYEPVGSRLPEATAPGQGPPATVEVTVGALDAPFVPLPGRAVRVDGVEGRFDTATGVLLADEPLDDGTAYTVDAAVGRPSDADLDAAERDRHGADAAVARRPVPGAVALSEVAGAQATTRTAGMTGTADVRQLRALQEFFADQGRFRLATSPVGGLSLRHLTSFVGTAAQGGVSEGSIEQFAAAYAVMARTLGYPTRVAVGYRTLEGSGGAYEVENRDAFAWAEVKLTGVGWVPFVAAPVTSEEAPPPPPQTAPVPATTTPPPPSSLPDARPDDAPRQTVRADEGGGSPPWVAVVLVVAGLAVVAGVAWAPVVRARRRRRRRRGAPAISIDGAWRETVDGLAAYRYPVTRAMTAPEVLAVAADYAGAAVPGAAGELARLANDARYGPGAPPPEAAGEAWRRSAAVLAWARRPLAPRVRARAFVDLRAALRGAR